MAAQGNKKIDNGGYVKSYGLAAYEILGVNLSNKELKELGFYVKEGEEDNDRDLTGERDGHATIQLEFACRSVGSNSKLRKFSFWLENKNDRNNPESEKGDLYKFINDQGITAWSKKPDEFVPLSDKFAVNFTGTDDAYNPRPAKVGEEQFMLFMRACMAIDFKSGGTLKYNVKRFFNGNVKELQEDLATDYLTTVVVATTIKVKEGDDGVKEIESFYPYAFAPGSYNKVILSKKFWSDEDCAAIHSKIANNKGKTGKERQYVTPLEQLIAKMTDPQYPCKELYYLGIVKDFTGENHVEMSEEAVVEETTDDDGSSSY